MAKREKEIKAYEKDEILTLEKHSVPQKSPFGDYQYYWKTRKVKYELDLKDGSRKPGSEVDWAPAKESPEYNLDKAGMRAAQVEEKAKCEAGAAKAQAIIDQLDNE